MPSPLGPTADDEPVGDARVRVCSWLRKSRSSIQRSRNGGAATTDRRRQPHGHHEVGELVALARARSPGFSPSRTSSRTDSPDRGLQPVREVGRVERDRDVLALVARLDGLDGLAEVRRGRGELDAERVELQPHRRGVPGEQAHAANGVDELLARDREPALVPLGEQLAVVRELALDQPRGERELADPERRPARRPRRARPGPSPRSPRRGRPRTAPAPARSPCASPSAVAIRSRTASRYESVATSVTPSRLTSSSTPVSTGRASSRDAAFATCDDGLGEPRRLDRHPLSGRRLQRREVLGRQQPERALVCRAPDPRLRLIRVELDGSVRERLHRVARAAAPARARCRPRSPAPRSKAGPKPRGRSS